MAYTAHKDQRMMEELEVTPEELDTLAKQTADIISTARHVVFFTGAGVSTACGIPDYRGPQGVWTLEANGGRRTEATVNMEEAIPSSTHMAMVELMRRGKLHFVISQNVDGLHRKSGIPSSKIAELHGNTNKEQCAKCGKTYLRDFSVTRFSDNHLTGRECIADGCGGRLQDTIINFKENLTVEMLNSGFLNSEKADVHICLGTSLTVAPANEMPAVTKERGGKLIIVNLQRTPLDQMADVRVHGKVDQFMTAVMRHLNFDIPPFKLERSVCAWQKGGRRYICGVDDDSSPLTVFSKFECNGKSLFPVEDSIAFPLQESKLQSVVELGCHFFGHYGEPPVTLTFRKEETHVGFRLSLDLPTRQWTVTRDDTVEQPSLAKGAKPRQFEGMAQRIAPTDTTTSSDSQFNGWFSVTPLRHCAHCDSVTVKEGFKFNLDAPCESCGNVGENMICFGCFRVFCGRHVQGHMLKHHEETGHSIVGGFKDLSIWCYPCEAYLNQRNKHLKAIHSCLYQSKFGEDAPDATTESMNAPSTQTTATSTSTVAPILTTTSNGSAASEEPTPHLGFEVHPKVACAHCMQVRTPAQINPRAACTVCDIVGENMFCTTCHSTFCGRHVNGHMLEHHSSTGHPIVLGVKDLSFWCYACDSYISETNVKLAPTYALAHEAKFSTAPPTH